MLIVSLAIETFYAKHKQKKRSELEKEATLLMMQGKFNEFYSFLNNAKFVKAVPKFYRAYFKMNGAIMEGNDSLIEESIKEIQEIKMNKSQKSEIYLNAFNYYIDKDNKEEVEKYKTLLLENTNDLQTLKYVQRLYDTKILKSDKHLKEILEELDSSNKVNKLTDYLLLIEIYKNLNDKDNMEKYNNLYIKEMEKSLK